MVLLLYFNIRIKKSKALYSINAKVATVYYTGFYGTYYFSSESSDE